jgi:hypothetical protein
MAQYKVVSDNFALGAKGDTVDSAVLEGSNIAALIEGEHIVEISVKKKDTVSE